MVPLPAAGGDLGAPSAAALVFLREQEPALAPLDRDTLRALYGFTPAELRVAALLADGRSAPSVAGELGLSVETVRSHRKRLLEKTETHGQAEFVRKITASLAAVRPTH